MNNIYLLDCTLRDGGCVNDFNFGSTYMSQILDGVEQSGVEIIECGYIDENKGSVSERTQYKNEQVITDVLLKDKSKDKKYVAMIDYGKFDVNNLQNRTESSIDGIRLAFHKKDRERMIEWGKIILSKGYELYIQPMLVMRYKDSELIDFIKQVNEQLPEASAFYIVDSFGEMRTNDLNRVAYLVDNNLIDGMTIGFHSHNNLQLSYSNAISLLDFKTNRDKIFDVSIMGMGKGAGNLNAEIFAEHLNLYHGKKYNIPAMLYVIDNVLNQIKEDFYWGYSIEYYLSAVNHCTPSYAGYFYKKHTLTVDQVAELLGMIEEDKKISFDKEYAQKLYYAFNCKNYNDEKDMAALTKKLSGKNILVIAPGKSISRNTDVIQSVKEEKNCVTIALNHFDEGKDDYIYATKQYIYDQVGVSGNKLIVTSNVDTVKEDDLYVLNYARFNESREEQSDISLISLLNFLKSINVSDIYLAGCDGFKSEMDENYYDYNLNRPIDKQIAEERNEIICEYIRAYRKEKNVKFITPSLYD